MTHAEVAQLYAHEVIGGQVPACKYVRQACQRFIDDLKKPDFAYKFDVKAAEKVCNFVELLPHVKGRWAGKKEKIKLQPWQKFILCNLFGWINKETGARRFSKAYLEIARKNGKSMLAAAVGLYCFLEGGEYGAEVYSGATSEKQAWEVFRPAKQICERTPELVEYYGVDVRAKNLSVIADGSRFEPIIGNPGDGSSPSCAIVDEYHEHKTPDLYDTMLTGMGSRENPLMFVITTAGTDISSPCHDMRQQMIALLSGVYTDESIFSMIYSVDEGVEWSSVEALEQANPNIGVSTSREFLLAAQRTAIQDPAKQNIFKIKHLDIWVNARETWINLEDWKRCADTSLVITDFAQDSCFISVDLAQKIDIAAAVKVFVRDITNEKTGAAERHYYVFPDFYLPLETIQLEEKKHYQKWYGLNLLRANEGAELDYNYIRDEIRGALNDYEVREVVFDPWRSAHLMHELAEEGATCVDFRNTPKNMTEAMREMEAAIKSGRLHHPDNEVLNWMASNAIKKNLPNELTSIDKEKAHKKIDGIVALAMGIARAMYNEDHTSVYESRGILII